jgi:type IV pilus assembly protein PilX
MAPSPDFCNGFNRHHTSGVILFVALIFLVLITIIAITASSISLMQEKMAGAMRNAHLAASGAESALREGESRLWNAAVNSPAGTLSVCGTTGLLGCYVFDPQAPNPTVKNFRTSPTWTSSGAQTYSTTDMTDLGSTNASANLGRNPVYIIEDLGPELPPGASFYPQVGIGGVGDTSGITMQLYRITARSMGGNDSAIRVIESTFAVKGN